MIGKTFEIKTTGGATVRYVVDSIKKIGTCEYAKAHDAETGVSTLLPVRHLQLNAVEVL